jgi:hypothetical protein
LSDEEKNRGLKEETGDFELRFSILICGIHSYDGIIRRNICRLAMVNLEEKGMNTGTVSYIGKSYRCKYKQWKFSSYFIVITLTFIMLSLLIILIKFFNRKNDMNEVNQNVHG